MKLTLLSRFLIESGIIRIIRNCRSDGGQELGVATARLKAGVVGRRTPVTAEVRREELRDPTA